MSKEPEQLRRDQLSAERASLLFNLRNIHSALDRALGDTDITHKTDGELFDDHPVQWAAQMLAGLIQKIERNHL